MKRLKKTKNMYLRIPFCKKSQNRFTLMYKVQCTSYTEENPGGGPKWHASKLLYKSVVFKYEGRRDGTRIFLYIYFYWIGLDYLIIFLFAGGGF